LERSENPGIGKLNLHLTLKGFASIEPFQVSGVFCAWIPRLSLRSNRWAEISERLRRILEMNHYHTIKSIEIVWGSW
jgi:hypothetical protein